MEMTTMTETTITATEFISAQPRNMPAAELVKLAREAGLKVSPQIVYNTRSRLKQQANGVSRPKRSRAKKFSSYAAGLSEQKSQARRLELRSLIFALGTVTAREELEAVEAAEIILERGL